MKIAFTTTFDATDVSNWSGTPYHMAQSFKNQVDRLDYIGNLNRHLPFWFKTIQILKKFTGQRESPRFNMHAAYSYSMQVDKALLNLSADVIVSPRINPIVHLKSKLPTVLWTDALYASLIGFYPQFNRHSARTIKEGNKITQDCLNRCQLAIFSSEWAARTALEIYGIDEKKVRIVPFGANITSSPTAKEFKTILANKAREKVKLLFIGKNWYRKGGDTVFSVAKSLYKQGIKVEVDFIGCNPPNWVQIPSYINCHGFISKKTKAGRLKIKQLFNEAHFLFVPSRAEAYGIVFCEANSFGLPALSTQVGGITTVIKNNINGMTFPLEANPQEYADYIIRTMQPYSNYETLALSSYNEFITRLNWNTATKAVCKMIKTL